MVAVLFILNLFTLKQSINVLAKIVPVNAWILTTPLSSVSYVSRNFIPAKNVAGSTVVCVPFNIVRKLIVPVGVGKSPVAGLLISSTLSYGQLLIQFIAYVHPALW